MKSKRFINGNMIKELNSILSKIGYPIYFKLINTVNIPSSHYFKKISHNSNNNQTDILEYTIRKYFSDMDIFIKFNNKKDMFWEV